MKSMSISDLNGITDEKLVSKFKGGDEQAFEALCLRYDRFIRAISQTFFIFCGDRDDLRQEGLFGLLYAANKFDEKKEGASSFKTFAYTCIRARILNAVNGEKAGKRLADTLSVSIEETFSEGNGPGRVSVEEEVIDSESVRERVAAIRKNLSHFEIKVFDLYLEGYSYTEIAAILDKPTKSVDNALQRIKEKAKKSGQ